MNAIFDVAALYDAALASGVLQPDAAQREGIAALNKIFHTLTTRQTQGFWQTLFGRPQTPQADGAYLYGPVGRGKSMVMQYFIDALNGWNATQSAAHHVRVERHHFHAFMLDLHHQLFLLKRAGQSRTDPLDRLADRVADRLDVLCFDEFLVSDVTDAMLLMPFFTRLLDRQVCVIATSNFAPVDLYKNGLQRGRFLPFIALLQQYLHVVLIGGPQDFRNLRWNDLARQRDHWLTPLDAASQTTLETIFTALAGHDIVQDTLQIEVPDQHRDVEIYKAASRVAWLRMSNLLAGAVGAADFLALAARFDVMLLDGIMPFAANENDRAKRFMVLIDTLYEAGTQIYARASVQPNELYPSNGRLDFEFARTVSRLQEMRVPKTTDTSRS